MITVEAVNLTGLQNDKPCRYEVTVRINRLEIWFGIVDGHMRKRGGPALLRLIAAAWAKDKIKSASARGPG